MHLALIYHQFLIRGGLEGYLLEFASRLKQAGHKLTLVTAEAPGEVVKALDADLIKVPAVKGSALLRMWQFERQASRIAHEIDANVTIGFGRTTTHDLHRAGGGCHQVYSELLPPWKRWGLKNQLELSLERQLYTSDHTKLFVVNSAQVANQLQQAYGTAPERFRVIYTAVDTEKYRPAEDRQLLKQRICATLKSDPALPAFLFVSLSHRRKGLEGLLKAWEDVDADLWIVGNSLSKHFRRLIIRHGLEKRVFHLAKQSDVTLLYQAADWFVHPTLYDACANTVLQSMATGLPGIISARDGALDLLRDGQNGLVLKNPEEAGEIQRLVLQALAMTEEERSVLSQRARETMMPLTWQAHLDKWIQVIDDL
jgi:UDP-glucose:(heptosyl)LPS alpha-1,3-glucosyltransferase